MVLTTITTSQGRPVVAFTTNNKRQGRRAAEGYLACHHVPVGCLIIQDRTS